MKAIVGAMKMRLLLSVCLVVLLPVLGYALEDYAMNSKPFGLWVQEFKTEAGEKGIDEQLLNLAFHRLEPNNRIIELDRKQPEGTKTFTQYLRDVLPQSRIDKGRALYRQHKPLLDKIAGEYGVQPRFIVALWGIETNYGGYTGNFSIIEALATLAYDGRRSEFFRSELLKALQIVQDGHISLDDMTGSWAGAMGQCQFMPSSFLNFAVDYNGDGRKDIWNDLEDTFASIANYLSQSGWNDELTWGRPVQLPEKFNYALADGKSWEQLSSWQAIGVRRIDGSDLPDVPVEAALTLPGEKDETAYLIYRNYDVILKWNRSRYFATAVGTLSNKIGGLM